MEGKKTIAERLREACKSEPFNNDLTYDIKVGEIYVNLSWEEASNLAEEIEAEQKAIIDAQGGVPAGVIKVWADNSDIPMEDGEGIPSWLKRNFAKLPCDRAGEPWHIGDETDNGRISGFTVHELYPVPRVLIHKHGMDHHATAFDPGELERAAKAVDANGKPIKKGERLWSLEVPSINGIVSRFLCQFGKIMAVYLESDDGETYNFRPSMLTHEKPVLDADGVEIKVGDTVYETKNDEPLTVYEVNSMYVHAKTENGGIRGNLTACYLTHEKPVFDADGVRICKGDTVWHITRGEKHTVEKVDGEDRGIFIEGCNSIFSGVEFTHREPDSLEKLRDDMQTFVDAKHPASAETMCGYCSRLTALMERGA